MPQYATPEATLYDRINAQAIANAGQPLADYGKAQADFAMRAALERQRLEEEGKRMFMAHQLQRQSVMDAIGAHNQNTIEAEKRKNTEAGLMRERAKGDVRALNSKLKQLEDAYQSTMRAATPQIEENINAAAKVHAAQALGLQGDEADEFLKTGVTPAFTKKYPSIGLEVAAAKEALRKDRAMYAPDAIRTQLMTLAQNEKMVRGLYDNAVNTYGKYGGVMSEIFPNDQTTVTSPDKERSPLPGTKDQGAKKETPASGPAAITTQSTGVIPSAARAVGDALKNSSLLEWLGNVLIRNPYRYFWSGEEMKDDPSGLFFGGSQSTPDYGEPGSMMVPPPWANPAPSVQVPPGMETVPAASPFVPRPSFGAPQNTYFPMAQPLPIVSPDVQRLLNQYRR